MKNKKMKKIKKDTQGEIFQRVTFSDVAALERLRENRGIDNDKLYLSFKQKFYLFQLTFFVTEKIVTQI